MNEDNFEKYAKIKKDAEQMKGLKTNTGYLRFVELIQQEMEKNKFLFMSSFEQYRKNRGLMNISDHEGQYLSSVAVPITVEEFNMFREKHITAYNCLEFVLGLVDQKIKDNENLQKKLKAKKEEKNEAQKRHDAMQGRKML